MNEFEQRVIEALATISQEQKATQKEVSIIHGKLDKALDPEKGIYAQHQRLEAEVKQKVQELGSEVNAIKRTYKWAMAAAAFVAVGVRELAIRLGVHLPK